MLRTLPVVMAIALGSTPALLLAQSPPSQASVTVGGKNISIQYSSPSVRGRKIFGDGALLSQDPTYPAWRAGANSATTFKTAADLDIGGLAVPKGTYTLYAWVSMDLGRIKMTMSKPPAVVEALKYTLTDKGNNKAELRLEWEHHIATVPITVK
jgi:Protein of unknown function (DUF2911)